MPSLLSTWHRLLGIPTGAALVVLGLTVPALPAQRSLPAPDGVALRPVAGFIENVGQWDTAARFVARFDSMILRAEAGALVLHHEGLADDGQRRGSLVRLDFTWAKGVIPSLSVAVCLECFTF